MSMETAITRAWQRQAVWLWLLLPISWIYGLLIKLRYQGYKLGWFASYHAPIPVMIIGNISVGGSGKTPLIISVVSYLQQRGVQVGVISRGYGGNTSQMPAVVTARSLPCEVGDEPCLIVNMTGVAMAVCPDRQQAIETLLSAHPNLQLIIADDGLQHYALQRDIEWIVVDVARGFGNQQLLPTGFLREPMSRLKDATVIYHKELPVVSAPNSKQYDHQNNNQKDIQNDKPINSEDKSKRLTMHLQPDTVQPLLSSTEMNRIAPMIGDKVHAVSGIGYPQRFFATLSTLGFDVIPHPYPDHHAFSLSELLQYEHYPILITSKDAVKIRALFERNNNEQGLNNDWHELASRLWVLPVTAELSTACYQTLQRQLIAVGVSLAN